MKLAIHIVTGSVLALSIAASAHAAKREPSPESIREDLIVAHCKAEAKKYHSIIHPRKRRVYEKNCIDRAHR